LLWRGREAWTHQAWKSVLQFRGERQVVSGLLA
jgi:hypothetical protein